MAYYAFLDENNTVVEVIFGMDETQKIDKLDTETWYSNYRNQKCVRTSYNKTIRKNFAGVGYTYDETRDAFIAPKPTCHPSKIIFDEQTCCWSCPDPEHEIGLSK